MELSPSEFKSNDPEADDPAGTVPPLRPEVDPRRPLPVEERPASSATTSPARQQVLPRCDDAPLRLAAENELLYSTLAAACVEDDLLETIRQFVRGVCRIGDSPFARVLTVSDDGDRLLSIDAWYVRDLHFEPLQSAWSQAEYRIGHGLLGAALEKRGFQWTCDLGPVPDYQRIFRETGVTLGSALAVPICVGNQIIALAEFFWESPSSCDARLALVAEWAARLVGLSSAHFRSKAEAAANVAQLQLALAEVRQTQAQLVHAEKMASLGVLAAGIAHEINSPIGYVGSNLNALRSYVAVLCNTCRAAADLCRAIRGPQLETADHELKRLESLLESEEMQVTRNDVDSLLNESAVGLQHVAEIVQDLRSFARTDESEVCNVDLNAELESTLKMIRSEFKYKCKIEKEFRPLPRLCCRPRQLNQVFMNLIMNAAQSIADQGIVRITTASDGVEIIISVSDTGAGIPQENASKIFLPFFTTKPIGQGTGLGLSVSYGIIQKHGGDLSVESQVGIGSTFTIRLPIKGSLHE